MSSHRRSAFVAVLAPLFLTLTLGLALAAQATPEPASAASPASYRIEYVIREYEGAKLINARHYEFDLSAPAKYSSVCSVRADDIVPVPVASGADTPKATTQYAYPELGIDLDCQLHPPTPQGLPITTSVNITSAAPAPAPAGAQTAPTRPLTRNLRTRVDSLVRPNHPTGVASLDDVATNHRFEIVVTAVPLP